MEMPIRIMMTLFVVFIVGTAIIVFSKEMIGDAQKDLRENRPGLDDSAVEDQKIIQLNDLDDSQIISLMQECYNKHHGKTLDRELCFAVSARTADWRWANVEAQLADLDCELSISDDVADGDYALNIYFDPYGASETIEISR